MISIIARPGPIQWIKVVRDKTMKAGIRPIAYIFYMAVFDWVEMSVVDMPGVVGIIAYRVLPKPTLPKRVFAFGVALVVKV